MPGQSGEFGGNLGEVGYSDRTDEARAADRGWGAVREKLSAKGSLVGEQLAHLSDFQSAELDNALNLAGLAKETLGNLSDGELAAISGDVINLASAADVEAARAISRRIASNIE